MFKTCLKNLSTQVSLSFGRNLFFYCLVYGSALIAKRMWNVPISSMGHGHYKITMSEVVTGIEKRQKNVYKNILYVLYTI